jgi:hypothetical protein
MSGSDVARRPCRAAGGSPRRVARPHLIPRTARTAKSAPPRTPDPRFQAISAWVQTASCARQESNLPANQRFWLPRTARRTAPFELARPRLTRFRSGSARSRRVGEVRPRLGIEGLGSHVDAVRPADRSGSGVDGDACEIPRVAQRLEYLRHSRSEKSTSPTVPSSNVSRRR